MESTVVAAPAPTMFPAYTDHPNLPPGMVFPSQGHQILSNLITLLGLSALAYCFARRSDHAGMWTHRGLREVTWPKLCVVFVFVVSWMFLFSAGILMSGAGLSTSALTCSLAIFSCITFYALSKLFIYLFLIEKVYIVWASYGSGGPVSRFSTPAFRVCIGLLLPMAVIVALMTAYRVADLRAHDRVCVIGLRKVASLSLLIYDLFMTVVLTGMFIYPLWTSKVSPKLRNVASRTLVASCAALATSCANIAILTVLHGKELGWVCLSSCGTDVTLNALVIFWVTHTKRENRPTSSAGHHGGKDIMTPPGTSLKHSLSEALPTLAEHSSPKRPAPVRMSSNATIVRQSSSVMGPVTTRTTRFVDPVRPESGSVGNNKRSTGIFGGVIDLVRRAGREKKTTDGEEEHI